jgi:sulfur-oxidizing protein SoxA
VYFLNFLGKLLFLSLSIGCNFLIAQDRISGNEFLTKELLNLSKDSSINPISLWVDQGAQLWQQECQTCHQNSNENKKGQVVQFPKWRTNRLMNLEDQIIDCFLKRIRKILLLRARK